MPDVISFKDAIELTEGEDRALLIGNGFSAQYFSYANLLAEAGLEVGSPIRNLFDNLQTVDFEAVVRSLEDAVIVERSYGNEKHAQELERDAQRVREALVHAVRTTHPEHREEVVSQFDRAAEFLEFFESVFSLNYDLLLYWTALEKGRLRDGFGLGKNSADGRLKGPFKEDAYCSVFNLHGGLHLFQDEVGDVYKALNTGDGVIATIATQITGRKKMPLYVAESSSQSKMRKINSVAYLRHCYDMLQDNTAAVFVYGHSADENDSHIYQAIFGCGAKHVYFGTYHANDDKVRKIDAQLSKYAKLAGEQIPYTLYASETASVWGDTAKEKGKEE